MIINLFKNPEIFNSLIPYNEDLLEVWNNTVTIKHNTTDYEDINGGFVSYWFDVRQIELVPFWFNYPEIKELNYDKKFVIKLNRSNYLSLFLINLLYGDKKDVMIEDAACGMCNLSFFLSKLGFTNFSFIDNFSQISQLLFEKTLEKGNIKYQLNRPEEEINAVIYNQISYPKVLRKLMPSYELICVYANTQNYIMEDKRLFKEHILSSGFKFFCQDSDNLLSTYCRNDKYDEFIAKITPYKV